MDDELLTTREAAALARCSPETVIRWVLHDGLEGYRRRCGKGWRYLVSRRALLRRLQLVAPGPAPVSPRRLGRRTREILGRLGLADCVG